MVGVRGGGQELQVLPEQAQQCRPRVSLTAQQAPLHAVPALLPAVFIDVSQNGKLLTAAACISRYPQLQGALSSHQTQQHQQAAAVDDNSQIGWLAPEPEPVHPSQPVQHAVLLPPSVVTVWASLARSMVTAHQRRGESDFVAQWLFQLLALDSQAVEWSHVLH